jgi:pyridoxine 4-dehydrogenase
MPQIAGKEVGPLGYGLMGFTWRPNPCPEEQAFAAMREAIAQGCTYWNGGDFYGTPEHNTMTLLERYFAKYPEDAAKVVVGIKGAVNTKTRAPDGSPENVRKSIDNMITQLGSSGGRVNVFGPARRDKNTPFDVTLNTINDEYVSKGLVDGIFISEVSAATIHEAVMYSKIACVEVELSLWCTDVLNNGVADACALHGIPLVAYSPLGRGMLTGEFKSHEDIPEGDIRRNFPRFQPENFHHNLTLVRQLEELAAKKGCKPSQLAIGWIKALERRPGMPTIIPIPGATTAERVRENAHFVELNDDEMAEIDATLAKFEVKGGRYYAGAPTNT